MATVAPQNFPSHVSQSLPHAWVITNSCLRKRKIFEWCFKYISIGILKGPLIGVLKKPFDWHSVKLFRLAFWKTLRLVFWRSLSIGIVDKHFDWNSKRSIRRGIQRVHSKKLSKSIRRMPSAHSKGSIRRPVTYHSKFKKGQDPMCLANVTNSHSWLSNT